MNSEILNADNEGGISLGANHADKFFRVTEQPNSDLLLTPVVIHEREAWLFKNPEALAIVRRGMEESSANKGEYLVPSPNTLTSS